MKIDVDKVIPKLTNLIGEQQLSIALHQVRIEELEAEVMELRATLETQHTT